MRYYVIGIADDYNKAFGVRMKGRLRDVPTLQTCMSAINETHPEHPSLDTVVLVDEDGYVVSVWGRNGSVINGMTRYNVVMRALATNE